MKDAKDLLIYKLSKVIAYLFIVILLLICSISFLIFSEQDEQAIDGNMGGCVVIDDGSLQAGKMFPNGEKLFKANCASCHKADKRLVGPPLKNIFSKYELDRLHLFITNEDVLIQEKDSAVLALRKEYQMFLGKPEWKHNVSFTIEEVNSIGLYLSSW